MGSIEDCRPRLREGASEFLRGSAFLDWGQRARSPAWWFDEERLHQSFELIDHVIDGDDTGLHGGLDMDSDGGSDQDGGQAIRPDAVGQANARIHPPLGRLA